MLFRLPPGMDKNRRINLLLVLLITGCLLAERFFGQVQGVQPALKIITWMAAGGLGLGIFGVHFRKRKLDREAQEKRNHAKNQPE